MEILNAQIINTNLSMADHGCLTFDLCLNISDGSACSFGGYCIGHGYLGAETFTGSEKGTASLMKVMDVIGVDHWEYLKYKYCRVKVDGNRVVAIGNLMEDNWFNPEEFFGTETKK